VFRNREQIARSWLEKKELPFMARVAEHNGFINSDPLYKRSAAEPADTADKRGC
jgi:hypothetical protein